jgi:hypothetical protein
MKKNSQGRVAISNQTFDIIGCGINFATCFIFLWIFAEGCVASASIVV